MKFNYLQSTTTKGALATLMVAALAGPVFAQEKTVTIMSSISGEDGQKLQAAFDQFTEQTGIVVRHEGLGDFETQIFTRVESGNAPDLVLYPQSGTMLAVDEIQPHVDLNDVLDMAYVEEKFPASLLDMTNLPDRRPGFAFWGLVNSSIFYRKDVFADEGYSIPDTWEGLLALTDEMKADGYTPWCVAMESSAATGWIGADWVMDMILAMYPPEVYEGWTTNEIKFSDPRIKAAFEEVGKILLDNDAVFGGSDRMLSTPWDQQSTPMFLDEPNCVISHIPTFGISVFPEPYNKTPSDVLGQFLFPKADTELPDMLVSNSDFVGILNDTPEAREFARFLTQPEALKPFLESGAGFLAINADTDPAWYPVDMIGKHAEWFANTPTVRDNAVDQFPPQAQLATWGGIARWIEQGGEGLDEILAEIDASFAN